MENQQPWHLTILLLEGLRHMRPEKVWRPIVTFELDKHHYHETVLGVDGQNINQRESFKFYDATPSTKMEVKVWYRSQSKKKKRRVLVASAAHLLSELIKKQEADCKIEVRLTCRATENRPVSSRGRPQKGALLKIKLRAPTMQRPQMQQEIDGICPADDESSACDSDDSKSIATTDMSLPEPFYQTRSLLSPQQSIRRRIKGYAIDTDDEICSSLGGYQSDEQLRCEDASLTCVGDDDELCQHHHALIIHPYSKDVISFATMEAAASNLPLPLYTEKVTIPPDFSTGEKFLASCTMYGDLSVAETDDHFDPVFRRLQQEWSQSGALLCALSAIDTAVFTLSPGSMFMVSDYAKSSVALSSIASGVGLACDIWFLLRYTWIDVPTFMTRARDVYGTYLFFSISARVPMICTFISAVSLMGFLSLVAFATWPEAVLVLCFVVGILMSLQFLVYGVHLAAKTVANRGRAGGRRVIRALTLFSGSSD